MMTHPDELFELAKQKVEQNQREISLAHVQTYVVRHWLAERVRRVADRLEATNYIGNNYSSHNYSGSEMLPLVKRY
jgi:hypothetical protein